MRAARRAAKSWLFEVPTAIPSCRAVLVLHDIEGFTHEEIARQLGIAVGTSKSQLFAARRAARALLGGQEEMSHA